jgi:seryl-tRNA synthetase
MLDPQLLRKEPQSIAERLALRGYTLDLERFNALEARRKAAQSSSEALQARRNALSRQIGRAKTPAK